MMFTSKMLLMLENSSVLLELEERLNLINTVNIIQNIKEQYTKDYKTTNTYTPHQTKQPAIMLFFSCGCCFNLHSLPGQMTVQ